MSNDARGRRMTGRAAARLSASYVGGPAARQKVDALHVE
jgi:hypothetical protein